jgi:hypothetical protein
LFVFSCRERREREEIEKRKRRERHGRDLAPLEKRVRGGDGKKVAIPPIPHCSPSLLPQEDM